MISTVDAVTGGCLMLGRTLGTRCRRLAGAVALGVMAAGLGLAPLSASAAGLPDLMLGVGAPSTVAHGTTFSYRVKLHNDGSVAALQPSVLGTLHQNFQITKVTASDSSFTCEYKNNQSLFGEIWACGSRSLAPQGTVIVTITAMTPVTPGTYTLQNMADPNNLVTESDEGNNQANQSIQVS